MLLKNKRVLLVEDDAMIRDAYEEEFKHSGFIVDVAVTAAECFAKLKMQRPDIILLDLFLPKESGLDVLEKLKKDSLYADIPIIIITNIFVDREDLARKGASLSIIKSEVTPGQLSEKIEDVLKAKA